jgi:hypothetical protein
MDKQVAKVFTVVALQRVMRTQRGTASRRKAEKQLKAARRLAELIAEKWPQALLREGMPLRTAQAVLAATSATLRVGMLDKARNALSHYAKTMPRIAASIGMSGPGGSAADLLATEPTVMQFAAYLAITDAEGEREHKAREKARAVDARTAGLEFVPRAWGESAAATRRDGIAKAVQLLPHLPFPREVTHAGAVEAVCK